MADPFIGEVRPTAFNFAPSGWALCDGRLLAISQNTTLFAVLGTTYGGDGVTNFALPDLRGRVPMHPGPSISQLGLRSGNESVTLTSQQMAQHTHGFAGSTDESASAAPTGNVLAAKSRRGLPAT